jgi:hypothetical protein
LQKSPDNTGFEKLELASAKFSNAQVRTLNLPLYPWPEAASHCTIALFAPMAGGRKKMGY